MGAQLEIYLWVSQVLALNEGLHSMNRYCYRYSRVETLSGFANGLFLCLISIFIVFEAVQRLVDPPEMNTGQLLVVSSVGLAVNLVGMVATGHNHHGHSHGGGGHSHGPAVSFSSARGAA